MASTRITRAELYELVWRTPMSRLAAEFGVSDVALAKTCDRLFVPRPGRGYWAQIAAGQKVKRPPLAKLAAGAPDSTMVERTPVAEAAAIPKPSAPVVAVPNDLRGAHETVRKLGLALATAEKDSHGRLLVPGPRAAVLAVTLTVHRRALLLLAGLADGAAARGHTIVLREVDGGGELEISVGDATSTVAVHERLEPKEHVLTPAEQQRAAGGYRYGIPKYDQVPSGRLQIVLNDRTRWRESWFDMGRRPLERALGKVLLAVEAQGARLTALRTAEEQQRQEQERRRLAAEEQRRRQALTDARAKHQEQLALDLRRKAAAWSEAENIRRFLTALRTRAEIGSEQFEAWIEWAERYAESLDPLCRPDDVARPIDVADASMEPVRSPTR